MHIHLRGWKAVLHLGSDQGGQGASVGPHLAGTEVLVETLDPLDLLAPGEDIAAVAYRQSPGQDKEHAVAAPAEEVVVVVVVAGSGLVVGVVGSRHRIVGSFAVEETVLIGGQD